MLAFVAVVVFVLAAFGITTIGSVPLLYVGLAFLSAHCAFTGPGWYPWPGGRGR